MRGSPRGLPCGPGCFAAAPLRAPAQRDRPRPVAWPQRLSVGKGARQVQAGAHPARCHVSALTGQAAEGTRALPELPGWEGGTTVKRRTASPPPTSERAAQSSAAALEGPPSTAMHTLRGWAMLRCRFLPVRMEQPAKRLGRVRSKGRVPEALGEHAFAARQAERARWQSLAWVWPGGPLKSQLKVQGRAPTVRYCPLLMRIAAGYIAACMRAHVGFVTFLIQIESKATTVQGCRLLSAARPPCADLKTGRRSPAPRVWRRAGAHAAPPC